MIPQPLLLMQSVSQQMNPTSPNCAPPQLASSVLFQFPSVAKLDYLTLMNICVWTHEICTFQPFALPCHPSSPGDQVLTASCQLGQGGHKDTDGTRCVAGGAGQWSELGDFK